MVFFANNGIDGFGFSMVSRKCFPPSSFLDPPSPWSPPRAFLLWSGLDHTLLGGGGRPASFSPARRFDPPSPQVGGGSLKKALISTEGMLPALLAVVVVCAGGASRGSASKGNASTYGAYIEFREYSEEWLKHI